MRLSSGTSLAYSGSLGGFSNDGNSGSIVLGSSSQDYSIVGSGLSLGGGSNENIYIARLDENQITCNQSPLTSNFGSLSLTTSEFSNELNDGFGNNATLTRTSVSNSDTTLCCQLNARVAGDTITICAGEQASLGRTAITGYQYNWRDLTSSAPISTGANPSVSPSVSGSYRLVVTSTDAACTSDSADVYVKVNPRQSLPSLVDTAICRGDSVTLTAPGTMVLYQWSIDGTIFSSQSLEFKDSATAVLFTLDDNTCVYRDTVEVIVNDLPAFNLGPDSTICDNSSLTLKGPSGLASYTWNGQLLNVDSLEVNSSQVYTLTVEDVNGCEFTDEVRVFTNPSSNIDLGPDTTVCEGEEVTFVVTVPLIGFKWNGSTINSGSTFTTSTPGTITVEAINSFSCPAYDTVELANNPLPVFSLGPDTGFCDAVDYDIEGPLGFDYLWFNGADGRIVNASGPGLFYLEITDANDCSYTDSLTIEQYTSPSITLGPDTALKTTDPYVLTPGSGFVKYEWSTGETSESISVTEKGK